MQGWWIASYVVLWILVATLCVIVVALARQIGALHLRLGPRGALEVDDEGPPLGEAPEPAEVTALGGERVRIGGPGAGERGAANLLLFVSPGCPVCEQVLPAVSAMGGDGDVSPFVLVDAEQGEAEHLIDGRRLRAPVAPASELARRYEIPGTPYAVVLDDHGIVRAKGTVNNLEQIEGLTHTAKRRAREAEAQA